MYDDISAFTMFCKLAIYFQLPRVRLLYCSNSFSAVRLLAYVRTGAYHIAQKPTTPKVSQSSSELRPGDNQTLYEVEILYSACSWANGDVVITQIVRLGFYF